MAGLWDTGHLRVCRTSGHAHARVLRKKNALNLARHACTEHIACGRRRAYKAAVTAAIHAEQTCADQLCRAGARTGREAQHLSRLLELLPRGTHTAGCRGRSLQGAERAPSAWRTGCDMPVARGGRCRARGLLELGGFPGWVSEGPKACGGHLQAALERRGAVQAEAGVRRRHLVRHARPLPAAGRPRDMRLRLGSRDCGAR